MYPVQTRYSKPTSAGSNKKRAAGPTIPSLSPLAEVLQGMTLAWTDDFTSFDNTKWNALKEEGGSTTHPGGLSTEGWPDHYGTYEWDPNLVTIENSILKLGWSYSGGVWKCGGISGGYYHGEPSKVDINQGVIIGRIKVPANAGFNYFMAFWLFPEMKDLGAWPKNGEIDILEVTRPNPDPTNEYKIAYSTVFNTDGTKDTVYSLSDFDVTAGFAEYAVYWRTSGSNVIFTFYINEVPIGIIQKTGANAVPYTEEYPFFLIISSQLGHWSVGLPPDTTLTSKFFEIDWVKVYTLSDAPPPGYVIVIPGEPAQPTWKDPTATVLSSWASELTLVWMDYWGTSQEPGIGVAGPQTNAPAMDRIMYPDIGYYRRFWQPDSSGLADRFSYADKAGRRCIKDNWPANITAVSNLIRHERNNWMRGQNGVYLICAVGADLYFDPLYMTTTQNGLARNRSSGKTPIGIVTSTYLYELDNAHNDIAMKTNAATVDLQSGCSCGLNWAFEYNDGDPQHGWLSLNTYIHHIGIGTSLRSGTYGEIQSNKYHIPHSQWNRIVYLVICDPSGRSKDEVRVWLNGQKITNNGEAGSPYGPLHSNIDLGGWLGNRGISGTGHICRTDGGGWGCVGLASHSMIGGVIPQPLPVANSFYWSNMWRRVGRYIARSNG